MKKLLLKILATVMAVICVFGLTACGKGDTKGTIAVCAKGESHAFWKAVKSGAEDAGEKYGYRVTFKGPVDESPTSVPQQKTQVSSALAESNLKGLVLATIGVGFTDYLEQCFDKKIPVVQFDSGVKSEDVADLDAAKKNPIVASVATSNVAAAGVAAEEFYKAEKATIDAATADNPYKIGIIQHDQTSTGIDRASGFKNKIKELCGDKVEVLEQAAPGDTAGIYVTLLNNLKAQDVKAVFMCNEGVVNQVSAKIDTGDYKGIKFVGFDAGSAQIDWIKSGDEAESKLIGSVAQDSYNIGYKAVEQCVNAIEGKEVKDVSIAGRWYNNANIDQMIKDNIVYEG